MKLNIQYGLSNVVCEAFLLLGVHIVNLFVYPIHGILAFTLLTVCNGFQNTLAEIKY
jgi:hypothetical protein